MAVAINIHEAKIQFSKLLRRVQLGEEGIVIAKAGKPIARLVPFAAPVLVRRPGSAKAMITMNADFDAPLPQELQKAFEAIRT